MSETLDTRPTLLETQLPVNVLSAETYKERKAGSGQLLTALGSYWKGRKPLILVRACVLAGLIPASDDPRKDREIFLKLMRMDEASLRVRRDSITSNFVGSIFEGDITAAPHLVRKEKSDGVEWKWAPGISASVQTRLCERAWAAATHGDKLTLCRRPEDVGEEEWPDIWPEVNAHLGTDARSIPQLVEQLGLRRFGHRPRVADPFCGGGSIPFEAARLGCDVYASDLNPIAGMLTWGALNIVGGPAERHVRIREAQTRVAAAVRAEIDALGIEQDGFGWRAKVYLYCLEITCPQTGWKIPLAPSWVISVKHRTIAVLVPDETRKRFDIEVRSGVSAAQLSAAKDGTVRKSAVHHPHARHRTVVTSISTLRGDRADGSNGLRRWEKSDFEPRPEDIFQERLYAIQWMKEVEEGRAETRYASVTAADLIREAKVRAHVRANLAAWQNEGWVSTAEIEPGEKTDEPIRTRGWAYWHHLFSARQIFTHSVARSVASAQADDGATAALCLPYSWNYGAKICIWNTACDKSESAFYNNAINTFYNYGVRGISAQQAHYLEPLPSRPFAVGIQTEVRQADAKAVSISSDLLITDPPYGDAVNYHEITEFFIAWLRKRPPEALKDWVWDSRRALAVKGSGHDFRVAMVEAFSNFSRQMPANGLQVVMFTHSSAAVWASLVRALWAAGLQVKAAWYVLTETTAGVRDSNLVQGTTLLVLRKRQGEEAGSSMWLERAVRRAVENKLAALQALDDPASPSFSDLDLIQAGYAAACEVLTQYAVLDEVDVRTDVLQPDPPAPARRKGRRAAKAPESETTADPSRQSLVVNLLDRAARYASELLIPARLDRTARGALDHEPDAREIWGRLAPDERFVLKALDAEADGARKLGTLQELSKLFGVSGWRGLLQSSDANDARLRTAAELRADELVTTSNAGTAAPALPSFAKGVVRHALWGIAVARESDDLQKALRAFEQFTPAYWERRADLVAVLEFLAQVRSPQRAAEAATAASLAGAVRNHTP